MQHVAAYVLVCMCVVLYLEIVPSHLLFNQVRRRIHLAGMTPPFFTWLRHIISFPWYRCPFSAPALTFWPSDPTRKTLWHPPPSLLAALYPPLSPPSIHLGSAADGWALMNGLQEGSGLLSGTFQSYCAGIERDGLKRDWHRFERRGKLRKKQNKLGENTKNCQSVQTISS